LGLIRLREVLAPPAETLTSPAPGDAAAATGS